MNTLRIILANVSCKRTNCLHVALSAITVIKCNLILSLGYERVVINYSDLELTKNELTFKDCNVSMTRERRTAHCYYFG